MERLILNDKVDLVLGPWGTHMNLAVAPIINKYKYPAMFLTATGMQIKKIAKRWPYAFWPLVMPDDLAKPLGTMLANLKKEGKIKGRIAAVHVAEQTGVELHTSMLEACKANGIEVVYSKSYPISVSDMSPFIREAQATNPDGFFCFSYPTDTFMVTETAQVLGFSPPIFYTGVGTPFPAYKGKFGAKTEGVLLWGGWDDKAPGLADYRKRHMAMFNRDSETGAAGVYATMQILQKAVETVGEIDRPEDLRCHRLRHVPDGRRRVEVQGSAADRPVGGRAMAERRGRRRAARAQEERAADHVPEAEVVSA